MNAVVVSLALLAVIAAGTATWWHLGRRRRLPAAVVAQLPPAGATAGRVTAEALGCPTCKRRYPSAMKFCPRDARPLIPAAALAADDAQLGLNCRVCRRSFDPSTRYCPFDAEELGAGVPTFVPPESSQPASASGAAGKICPNCGHRFRVDDSFCAQDGSELVPLN